MASSVTGIEGFGVNAARELRPRIREATFEDYDEVAALQARNGLATRPYADWLALWNGNPAYEQSGLRPPIGWVLETSGGQVGGFVGNLPVGYHFNGRRLRAATAYSWSVDRQHRGYSVILLDRFLKQKDVDLFVCSTVNATAETIYRAMGFSRVPVGTWDRAAFWITGYREFARCVLKAAPIHLPQALANPLAAVLSARDTISVGRPKADFGCEIDLCSGFDSRFDDFWENLKRENVDRLLAIRTRETLEWHFRCSLEKGRAWIVAVSKAGRLVAYGIFHRQDPSTLPLKRLRFADFQALRGFEPALGPVLEWMLRHCRETGIHVAENVGCWLEGLPVPGFSVPYRRKMKSWMFYYRASQPDLSRCLQDPAMWTPSSFDGDASL
jgi:hypothetical protein